MPLGDEARKFQHTAARRRLEGVGVAVFVQEVVSTHSRPKAAGMIHQRFNVGAIVSTHSRPKAAGLQEVNILLNTGVSTHSRPKAAGLQFPHVRPPPSRFNTQPPEGGWVIRRHWTTLKGKGFNTQPPEGGW